MIRNAKITSVTLSIADHGCLSAWLHLGFDGGGQGFGGYALHPLKTNSPASAVSGFAGHFIIRCCQIADVEKWEHLPGKVIRVDHTHNAVDGIGHALKEEWFYPSKEFKD